jgi:hypothetical protein
MEHEGLIPPLQELPTCSYLKPDQCSKSPQTQDALYYYPATYILVF